MTVIQEKFQSLKTGGFDCGLPVGLEIPLADGGTFQAYSTGVTIFASPAGVAHEVHGSILATYSSNGGPLGTLGYPVSDEYDNTEGGVTYGRVSDFENGSILFFFSTNQTVLMEIGPVQSSDLE